MDRTTGGTISIKLEAYEGPLDLLLQLIEKNKIDIYDIPISELTDQYMAHLEALSDRGMDAISSFLVMASALLEIKSKMLLPAPRKDEEEEPDPREGLVHQLIAYQQYKQLAGVFREDEANGGRYVYKLPEGALLQMFRQPPELEDMLNGITLEALYRVFDETLRRRELKTDKVRSGFNSVQRDLFTVDEKISYLCDLLFLHERLFFSEIFEACTGREEKVVTFLAVLDLIRHKKIVISQKGLFDEIIIQKYEGEAD